MRNSKIFLTYIFLFILSVMIGCKESIVYPEIEDKEQIKAPVKTGPLPKRHLSFSDLANDKIYELFDSIGIYHAENSSIKPAFFKYENATYPGGEIYLSLFDHLTMEQGWCPDVLWNEYASLISAVPDSLFGNKKGYDLERDDNIFNHVVCDQTPESFVQLVIMYITRRYENSDVRYWGIRKPHFDKMSFDRFIERGVQDRKEHPTLFYEDFVHSPGGLPTDKDARDTSIFADENRLKKSLLVFYSIIDSMVRTEGDYTFVTMLVSHEWCFSATLYKETYRMRTAFPHRIMLFEDEVLISTDAENVYCYF